MKRILITGGAGFIGTNLAPCLSKTGNKIVCLERPLLKKKIGKKQGYVKVINKDLVTHNPKEGISKGFNIIIHLAGNNVISDFLQTPEKPFFDNIYSTLNLLEDIRQNNKNCLLIFSSTEKVYGNPIKKEVDEEMPCSPLDAYGASKLVCELLIEEYHKKYKINYIIFRLSNVFGLGQNPNFFIPSVISKIIKEDKEIKVGNLSKYRNFVYINDLADAISNSINNLDAYNKTFNISSYNLKIEKVLKTIVKVAKQMTKKEIRIIQDKKLFRPLKYESKRYILNCKNAKEILNWEPTYTFEDAIEEILEHHLSNPNKNE